MVYGRLAHAERFFFRRKIGEGATSRVFEVVDRDGGGRFALKCLRRERVNPEQLARFKDEFRALQRLSHRNLAKVYELLIDDRGASLLMELVEGTDFLGYTRPGIVPPERWIETQAHELSGKNPAEQPYALGLLSIERLRDAVAQLVCGLRKLHGAGKVHCDIKSDNVLVDAVGRVVILDFGILAEARIDEHWRGTPAFMAPEQFRGVFNEAVDWYALGGLLYAALSGRLRTSSSIAALAGQRCFARPTDPRLFIRDLPDDLVELSLALLDPRPEARPTGAEVARAVGVETHELSVEHQATRFVGRTTECAELYAEFALACTGQSRVAHVHGDAGIGKSSLIRHFAKEAHQRGALVYRGSCYRDALVPYKGLDCLIDRLAAERALIDDALTAGDRFALATMFPVFAREGCVPVGLDEKGARGRAMAALTRLLAKLAEPRGLVLCLDDWHWSDSESLAILAELTQSSVLRRTLIVLGYRSEDSRGRSVQRIRQTLSIDLDLSLGPLEAPALRSLLDAHPAGRTFEAQRLLRETRGNPLWISELVRASNPHSGRGPSVRELLASRIDSLTSSERAYLELVAVAGRPIEERALRGANAQPPQDAFAARSTLVAKSLVRITEHVSHSVEIYDDLVREQVLAQLSEVERRARRLALALHRPTRAVAEPAERWQTEFKRTLPSATATARAFQLPGT
jgi:eukaryotic-like serine/threonine-protein kinase